MDSLHRQNSTTVDSAYIITIKGHKKSEYMSRQCQMSCDRVGMKYVVWDAYDGTGDIIKEPDHLKTDSVMKIVKVTNHDMLKSEIACVLSHLSLWTHCAVIDKPIVILEHDAIMIQKFEELWYYNSIIYLGGQEWMHNDAQIHPIPPHYATGPNHHFIARTHAYAIDPQIAKNLIAYTLCNGITTIADRTLRCDLFNITHQGLYAYNHPYSYSTIVPE